MNCFYSTRLEEALPSNYLAMLVVFVRMLRVLLPTSHSDKLAITGRLAGGKRDTMSSRRSLLASHEVGALTGNTFVDVDKLITGGSK